MLKKVAIAIIAKITAVIVAVSFKQSNKPANVSSLYIPKPIIIAHTPAMAADSEGVNKPA